MFIVCEYKKYPEPTCWLGADRTSRKGVYSSSNSPNSFRLTLSSFKVNLNAMMASADSRFASVMSSLFRISPREICSRVDRTLFNATPRRRVAKPSSVMAMSLYDTAFMTKATPTTCRSIKSCSAVRRFSLTLFRRALKYSGLSV